jgi:ribosomal protein L22
MSPDEPTGEQAPEREEQAKPAAKAKPAAARKAVPKKPASKKPASKKPASRKSDIHEGEAAAAEGKPATRKPTAKKQAEKEPVAETASSAETEKAGAARAEKAGAPKTEKPNAPKAEKPTAPKTEEPEKPASSASRDAQSAAPSRARRKTVRAQARYVRTSARKARMVCGHLRGKTVVEARAILAFTPREVARDWSKLLESAVANAENNHELIEDDLLVREAYADEGPTIKRFRPRAQGRATPIRKRTSHLTITLTPKP